jgi:RNA polymerase sigma-70 factor (ECF subfamily)
MDSTIDRTFPAAVVRAAAAGDEIAFARLVAALHQDLVRVAYVVCSEPDLAQDAAQSAWSIAWRKLRDVRDPDRVRTWLIAVAANEARQLMRRRRRQGIREIRLDPATGDRLPPAGASTLDDRLDVGSVLAELGADDRRLIAMRYSAGLTSAEIADVVGLSPGAVRMRLSRLLLRLRSELADD